MTNDSHYCKHCDRTIKGEHRQCNARDIAATGIRRYDSAESDSPYRPYPGMIADDAGEFVLWEDVVRLLRPKR